MACNGRWLGRTGLLGLCLAAGLMPPAYAADGNGPALEEIIITARKRPERLQDAPVAVTALTGAELDALRLHDFADYYRLVPGLQDVDRGVGNKKFILRGINSENSIRLGPIVQQYLDEFPLEPFQAGRQTDIRLYDVERVEVLRGPQGTLYGSGSMGGTIRTLSRKADPARAGTTAELTVSGTRKAGGANLLGNAVANLPLVRDQLALRLVAFGERWPGYIDNVLRGTRNTNDSKAYGGRATLTWKPSDRLDVNLMLLHQKVEAGAYNEIMPGFRTSDPRYPATLKVPGDLETAKGTDEALNDRNSMVNLSVVYAFDFATLTSVSTGYRRRYTQDIDFPEFAGPGSYIHNLLGTDVFGQELRLGQDKGRWKWLVGGFFQHGSSRPGARNYQDVYLPGNVLYTRNGTRSWQEQRAVFGETSFDLTEAVTATVGLRRAGYRANSVGIFLAGTSPVGAPLGTRAAPEVVNEDKTTKKVELSWKAAPGVLLYALAADGFRPGGFNTIAADPVLNARGDMPLTFRSDSLWNYEAGAKTSWLDGRVTANLVGYWIDWSHIQVTGYDSSRRFSFTTNAGTARSRGIELETRARLIEGLELAASGAFTDARLTQDQPGADFLEGTANAPGRSGDRLPNVPRLSFALSGTYSRPVADGLSAFITPLLTYTGASYYNFRPDDPLNAKAHAYTLLSLSTGVEAEAWRLTLFVDNLTDKRAQLFINNRIGLGRININRPRTIGLSARYAL
jgi:outer membrane receptor protein involved in Fe transport